jgi:glucose-1-phosphate adenylyltransferase
MTEMMALVLAGGLGQRMGVLCQARPKPILPFACRFSIIDFTLSNCVHSGIKDIAVLIDHQRSIMSDYIEDWNRINSFDFNIRLLEPEFDSYKGTADAIYQNIPALKKSSSETTLVLAGDHVYRMDYGAMLAFHKQVTADVTIGVVSVPAKQAYRFGIVTVDERDRITDFVEKPQRATSNLASMGIYLFNTQFLIDRLIEDHNDSSSNHDFGRTIIPRILSEYKVFAYRFLDYWQDVGNIEAYYWANMELIRKLPLISLNGSWPIMTKAYNVRPPRLINCANIRNSLIGEGCTVDGQVENSILFSGVQVREHATIRNSIVMKNSTIDSYTTVDSAILDEDVKLGQFCYVGFGAGPLRKDKGITVLGKGSRIPDYSAVNAKDGTRIELPKVSSVSKQRLNPC